MSGHSKWSTIKHSKAKNDAANAKVFTKILRELAVAVKEGGADPNSNNRLKAAIAKARSNNMPNDNIQRTIKKYSGELSAINYSPLTYEGYGAGGSAVIIETLTDNKNRTAGEMRHAFDKYGGSLGQTGSVSYLFNRVGEVIVLKNNDISNDDIMMHALEAGAEDVIYADTFFKIITSVENFESVKSYLEQNAINVEDSNLNMVPIMTITLDTEQQKQFVKMLDVLEDNDDVQEVYHNVMLTEEE